MIVRNSSSPRHITASGTIDSDRGFLHYIVLAADPGAAASLTLSDGSSTIFKLHAPAGQTAAAYVPDTRYSSLSATLTGTGASATVGISK